MEKKTNDNQKPANIWVSSAREFGQLRNIVFCGVMGALSVVLLFQIKCNMVARDGSIGESQFDVLHHQHLAGEG